MICEWNELDTKMYKSPTPIYQWEKKSREWWRFIKENKMGKQLYRIKMPAEVRVERHLKWLFANWGKQKPKAEEEKEIKL